MKEYEYPLNPDWSIEELVLVTNMWTAVEKANESGIDTKEFLQTYKEFKTVIRSIGEEKRLGKDFETVSGYSLYKTVQQAKNTRNSKIRMGGK